MPVKKSAPKRKVRKLVFDTETTGLLKPQISDLAQQPKIIEIGLVEMDQDYNISNRWSSFIQPEQAITEEITKITGITNEMLVGAPTFIQLLPEIEERFLGIDSIYAHNLPFDWGMLVNELRRIGREYAFPYPPHQMCTVQIGKDMIFGRYAKMTELYEKSMGKPLAQTHRALDDVDALVEIIIKQRW